MIIFEDSGLTWRMAEAAGLFELDRLSSVAEGSALAIADPVSPLARDMSDYHAVPFTASVIIEGVYDSVVEVRDGVSVVSHVYRPAPELTPWLDPAAEGHDSVALSEGDIDSGQWNLELAPLSFPFDDGEQGCVAVSINGYLRFGPAGACPPARAGGRGETDIDQTYPRDVAQISWLGGDNLVRSDRIFFHLNAAGERAIITISDVRAEGRTGTNDVQIILSTDSGDIQVSYRDCSFDTTEHWSFGVSEPGLEFGALHDADFTDFWPNAAVGFGLGGIAQAPEHIGGEAYAPLDGQAITYQRFEQAWRVMVRPLPL